MTWYVCAGVQNYDGTDTPVWAEPGNQRAQDLAAAVQTIEDTTVQLINTDQYDNMTQYLLDKVRKRRKLVIGSRYRRRCVVALPGEPSNFR